jgi:hypothetical protein
MRGPEDLVQDLAAHTIEIGHKLIEAWVLLASGKWPPRLHEYREPARTTRTSLDAIYDALCRTADAARCWEINPSTYTDHRLTRLVERTQAAIARAYPPSETTLQLLQQITPGGLKLGLIECKDSGGPLIAISVDADQTPHWQQAA